MGNSETGMDRTSTKTLFISHSSKDKAQAEALCVKLEAHGVACRIAPRDFDYSIGDAYSEIIVRAIAECTGFLFLASGQSMPSTAVRNELEQAAKYSKPIYTIMMGTPQVPGGVDYYISRLHWVELGRRSEDEIAKLLANVLSRDKAEDAARAWEHGAAPRSALRYIRYHRAIFFQSLAGTLAALALCAVLIAYLISRVKGGLESDYRSLGWISVAVQPTPAADSPILLEGQLWLAHPGEAVAPRLQLAWQTSRGDSGVQEVAVQPGISPVMLNVKLPPEAMKLAACLSVPGAKDTMRVTQSFAVTSGTRGLMLTERGEPRVSREDSSPCIVR